MISPLAVAHADVVAPAALRRFANELLDHSHRIETYLRHQPLVLGDLQAAAHVAKRSGELVSGSFERSGALRRMNSFSHAQIELGASGLQRFAGTFASNKVLHGEPHGMERAAKIALGNNTRVREGAMQILADITPTIR